MSAEPTRTFAPEVVEMVEHVPIRQRIRKRLAAMFLSVLRLFSVLSAEDTLYFLGLVFVGYGAYQFQPAIASIVVGVLLILLVRPMRRFF